MQCSFCDTCKNALCPKLKCSFYGSDEFNINGRFICLILAWLYKSVVCAYFCSWWCVSLKSFMFKFISVERKKKSAGLFLSYFAALDWSMCLCLVLFCMMCGFFVFFKLTIFVKLAVFNWIKGRLMQET